MLAQRRDIDRHHVKPVIKVLAKRALLERRAQVAIGGGNQPDINLHGTRAAQSLELALLQDAQQLDLRGRRNIADFVQEQRAFIGQFELSRLALAAPVKAPFS